MHKRDWLLVLALLLALASGGLYYWKWHSGATGLELLGFTAAYVCIPLVLSLLLLFGYFHLGQQRR
jgi:hypothetical protein